MLTCYAAEQSGEVIRYFPTFSFYRTNANYYSYTVIKPEATTG